MTSSRTGRVLLPHDRALVSGQVNDHSRCFDTSYRHQGTAGTNQEATMDSSVQPSSAGARTRGAATLGERAATSWSATVMEPARQSRREQSQQRGSCPMIRCEQPDQASLQLESVRVNARLEPCGLATAIGMVMRTPERATRGGRAGR